ncbi:hypothetical protein Hanom_Chr13g01184841 [Helianthus anomalus]
MPILAQNLVNGFILPALLQTMEFKDFMDCKALLDMMDDDEYIGKYKYILQSKFEEMVEWFITRKLGITTRPLPAYVSNNHWKVAKDMGFEYSDGELIRLIYVMYLDVLVYYYKFKIKRQQMRRKC